MVNVIDPEIITETITRVKSFDGHLTANTQGVNPDRSRYYLYHDPEFLEGEMASSQQLVAHGLKMIEDELGFPVITDARLKVVADGGKIKSVYLDHQKVIG